MQPKSGEPASTIAIASCPAASMLEAIAAGSSDDAVMLAHVGACENCRGQVEEIRANNQFLGEYAADLRPPEGFFEDPAAPPTDIITGYRMIREIHRGAQGIVYKAEQEHTKRIVAVKMLLQGAFATPRQRARFEREAEIAAGLRHPNIVTVYDSTPVKGNRFALVMEHIDGVALDQWCAAQRGPQALRTKLGLFAKVCDAVHYAHQRGVIHRDLKPGNILVDTAGEPHVLDFGIAKIHGPSAADGPNATQPGEFAGTLAYASPEQVAGQPDLIDTRTDVYALGVILHEMLTGVLPYPVDTHFAEVIRNITGAQPTRPSIHDRAIDDDLDTIVLRALDKDRDHRYQSAGSIGDDVRHWLKGEAIAAKRDSLWYVLRKNAQRRKGPAAAGLAIAAALLLGAGAGVYALAQRDQGAKMQASKEFLAKMISSVNPAVAQGRDVTRTMLERSEAELAAGVLARQPEVEAEVRMTLANAYRQLAMEQMALAHVKIAYDLRAKMLGEKNIQTAQSRAEYGLLLGLVHRDRLAEARVLIEGALATLESLDGKEGLATAAACDALGTLLYTSQQLDAAVPFLERAASVREAKLGLNNADTANSLMRLAMARWFGDVVGNLDDAEKELQRVLAGFHPGESLDHPVIAECKYNLANMRNMRRDKQGAIALFEEVLRVRTRLYGEQHVLTAQVKQHLGTLLVLSGKTAEGRSLLEQAVAAHRAWSPNGSLELGQALTHLGRSYALSREFEKAEPILLEAYAVLDGLEVREQAQITSCVVMIYEMYEAWGRQDKLGEWIDRVQQQGVDLNNN